MDDKSSGLVVIGSWLLVSPFELVAIKSSKETTLKLLESPNSFGLLIMTLSRLGTFRSAALRRRSNFVDEIIIFGSSSSANGIRPSGFNPVLNGTATAPDFRMP